MTDEINKFFHSVSAHLEPLDQSSAPRVQDIPDCYTITQHDVERRLMSTKVSKAPGPDGIPNWIFRDLAGLISGLLTSIFNMSVREGYLPLDWKSANVTPIPKTNPSRSIQSDIRPISLTPVIGKHIESIVGNWVLESITTKLDPHQYGALKGLSTTHALLDMLTHWHIAIHTRQSARILLLDYSKAFDLVDHNTLIKKFLNLGVPVVLVSWVHGFLSNRRQRVKLGKDVSDWLSLNGAMPQGSWLGPLCFIIYVSDMDLVPGIKTHKYIDDTTFSETILTASESKLQTLVSHWSESNHMRVNSNKTKEMLLHVRKTSLNPTPITIAGCEIERVKHLKLLGVWLSDDLTWDYHINKLLHKVSSRIY